MQLSIAKAPSRFEFKSVIMNEVSEYFEDRKIAAIEAAHEEAEIQSMYDDFCMYDDDLYDPREEEREFYLMQDREYDPYPYEDMYDDVSYNWD